MFTGFKFDNKPSNPPTFGQFSLFGTQQPTSSAASLPQFGSTFSNATPGGGFQLSSPTTSAPPFSAPSFNFGATSAQSTANPAASAFKATTMNSTGLSFAAPAMTSQATGLFNTAVSSSMAFATPQKSALPGVNLPFGASPVASTVGSTFGTPVTTTTAGLGFISGTATTAPNLGFAFGASSVTTSAPTFSLASTVPSGVTFSNAPAIASTGLTFGAQPIPSSVGLSFSTAASTAASAKLPFGTLTSASAINLSNTVPATSTSTVWSPFGAKSIDSSATAPVASVAPGLGTIALGGTALGTSLASTTTTGLTFSAPSTSLTFSTPLTSRTPTTTVSVTTTVSTSAATTTSAPLTFGVSSTITSLATVVSTVTPSFGVAPQPALATSTTKQSVGLGGVSASPPKQPGSGSEQAEMTPKDQPLPNELLQLVESFKKFVQDQKACSSEIARFSMKDLKKVENNINLVNSQINELERDLQRNKIIGEKLKSDTAKALQYAEMAQHTFDTPSGLQYENTAPMNYFVELADRFEKDMHNLKVRIDYINKCVRSNEPSDMLTSQDLSLGLRRLHDTFVALAGRLQTIHSQVELQKEQYLNLRKQIMHDYTNIFEKQGKEVELSKGCLDSVPYKPPDVITGPTPFSTLGSSQAQALAQNLPPAYPGVPTLGAPTSGFNMPVVNTTSLFGSNPSNTTTLFGGTSSFQLQKPPAGNKRGKP